MPPSAPRGPERTAGIAILAAFALASVLFTGFFPPSVSPNEVSRFQSVYAFVETGTFAIDGALRLFGDHEDKSVWRGHFYSNKAPGLAFAAIPVYRALRVFFPAPRSSTAEIFFLLRLLTVTLVSLIAVGVFLRRPGPPETALVTFALVFGTPFLFYGRSFFAHAWTASLLFLAWHLVGRRGETRDQERPAPGKDALMAAAAGLLAGWAAISEYTVAPLGIVLALLALRGGSWRRASLFVAGASLPLLLLLFYNSACFGSPWVLSSAREWRSDFLDLSRKGLFGFGPPSIRIAGAFLLHPARGLLLRSPFWLWLVPGFLAWWRSGKDRLGFLFALLSTGGFPLLLSGYGNWHGGWSLGNRYLLPILFLSGVVLCRALESPLSRGLFVVAAVYSAANHVLLTSSWAHFPADLALPAANGSFWFLSRGWIAPSAIEGGRLVALLLTALAIFAAGWLAIRAIRPASPRRLVAVPAALALFAASLALSPVPSFSGRLWRAAIYGGFSGLDPNREELRAVVVTARSDSERREAQAIWRRFGN